MTDSRDMFDKAEDLVVKWWGRVRVLWGSHKTECVILLAAGFAIGRITG